MLQYSKIYRVWIKKKLNALTLIGWTVDLGGRP